MAALLHPGVYVLEVPSGARTIEGVPTSTTIFVGEAERGPTAPTKIKGIADYERAFGGYLRRASAGASARVTLRYAVDAFFGSGGSSAYVLRAFPATGGGTGRRSIAVAATSMILEAHSPGVWAQDLHAIVLDATGDPTTRFRLAIFYRNLKTNRLEFVEDWDRLTIDPNLRADDNYAPEVLKRSNYVRWGASSTAITRPASDLSLTTLGLQTPAELTEAQITGATASLSTNAAGGNTSLPTADLPALLRALDGIDDAALIVAAPDVWVAATAPGNTDVQNYYNAFRQYVDNRPKLDLFYVADLPRQANMATTSAVSGTVTFANGGSFGRSTMVGAYWPHVVAPDPVGTGRSPTITLPPSGFVAGVFARTDARRGVWKAPAGVEATVDGIVQLEYDLLDAHSDDLNPIGVNALRQIPGAGPVLWGSRTLRPESEWRYVPVRRTAMFLRKSIFNGIQWAVFEPNDSELWQSLRATIGAFMETQFRNGAFAGRTARDAYFVKCDAETTTPIDQASGIVNILVGFAPLRPAEFVVVRLSQKTAIAS